MTAPSTDVWFRCAHCMTRFAKFQRPVKELRSHRTNDESWLLLQRNAWVDNVTFFKEQRLKNQFQDFLIPLKDDNQTIISRMANLWCSCCGNVAAYRIIDLFNREHPTLEEGQTVLVLKQNRRTRPNC